MTGGIQPQRPTTRTGHLTRLFVFLLLSGVWAAQEPGRAQGWQQQRLAKAETLAPPRRGGLENALYQFEERRILEMIQRGYRGFHPLLGGMTTGSGFAFGTEYRSESLETRDVLLRIAGQASLEGYQRYEFQVGLPELANDRLLLDLSARYRNYTPRRTSLALVPIPGPPTKRTFVWRTPRSSALPEFDLLNG